MVKKFSTFVWWRHHRTTREKFKYNEEENIYICPAGKHLYQHNYNERGQITEYHPRKGICAACPLIKQCTASKTGRKITRHDNHEQIMLAHQQGRSSLAKQDRRRRRYLMEGSFAQAANLYHFKRARWRRLWRQEIQNWLIAAAQNIKILLGAMPAKLAVASGVASFRLVAAAGFGYFSFLIEYLSYLVISVRIRFLSQPFGQHALKH